MRKRILILITLIIPVICLAQVSVLTKLANFNPIKYMQAGGCIGAVDLKGSRLFGYGISFSSSMCQNSRHSIISTTIHQFSLQSLFK